jgi:NADH-quinone oxidoreductase subunit A
VKPIDILLSPLISFIIFLLIYYIFYRLSAGLAPKGKPSPGKLTTYACGEDIPGYKVQFGYRLFFFVALFFTMMHVAALVVATVPKGPLVYFGIFYLGMIFLSILALITRSSDV